MALDDHDMLDRALDAAESAMLEAEPAKEVDAVTPQTEESAVEEVKEELQEEAPKKAQSRARDENGKFTKAQKADKSKPEISDQEESIEPVEVQPEQEGEPIAQEPIDPPMFWTAEHKGLFAKLPQDAQSAILHYEKQRNDWANRVSSEAQRGRELEKRFNEAYEPYRLKLQANGLKDPIEATSRLLAWNELFEKDPRSAIADLMTKNNLSAYDFLQDAEGQTSQYSTDPRVEQALKDAQEAKQLAEQYQSQIKAQAEQAALAQIESFKQGKDSSGQARAQYFEWYKPQIVNAAQEIIRIKPELSELQALDHAYEFVISEAKKAFGVNRVQQQPQQAIQTAKPDVNRAKAAASSVTGAPASGGAPSRPKAKTIDEALDLAEQALGLRG